MAAMAETRLDFGILLTLACAEFVWELRGTLAGQGFADQGRSDGYVLRSVCDTPMTVSDLADRLEISKQGAGQIVDDMERRACLAEEVADPRRIDEQRRDAALRELQPRAQEPQLLGRIQAADEDRCRPRAAADGRHEVGGQGGAFERHQHRVRDRGVAGKELPGADMKVPAAIFLVDDVIISPEK